MRCRWPPKATGPTVGAIERALAETGYSRFPVVDPAGQFVGYVHIKDVLPLVDDADAVVDAVRGAPAAAGPRDVAAARRAVAAAARQQPPRAGHRAPMAA